MSIRDSNPTSSGSPQDHAWLYWTSETMACSESRIRRIGKAKSTYFQAIAVGRRGSYFHSTWDPSAPMADDGTTGREPWIAGAAILTFQPQRAIQDKALSPRRISENAMAFGTPAP